MSVITLTTDFGTRDWFVGAMKGVILDIDSGAEVVDLTHDIPAGDIRSGAFALAAGCRFFPEGTVHVAVVDPGVGGPRKGIAVKTARYTFVGPDNGVLSWALTREKHVAVHDLQNEACFARLVSRTFHGRDIFAPVAAHIGKGLALRRLGPTLDGYRRLPWPEPVWADEELRGEVVYVDRFGNAITNLDAKELDVLGKAERLDVLRGRTRVCGVALFYTAVPDGKAVAVIGSSGLLEIAVNGGEASRVLRLRVGTRISVRCR